MADPRPARSFSAALPARSANLRFGRFELQTDEQRLLVDGQPAPWRARTLTWLLALAQRAGSLVTRQELLDLVWPGLVVEENNLSVQINALRKVLGSEVVVTIPGRGYRFKPPVSAHPARLTSVPRQATPRATHLPPGLPLLIGREVALAPVTQAAAVPAAMAAALGMRLLDHENPFAALAQTLASLQVLSLRLAGFADAAFVALGQPREQVDQIRIDRAERLARAALGDRHDLAACERLKAEGAATRLDDLPRLAFGA